MMIDFDLSTLIIGLFILGFVLAWMKRKRNKSNVYMLCFSVFYVYILYVLKYTIFPIRIGAANNPLTNLTTNINLVPFNFPYTYFLDSQVLLNILLTIPFGFGISYIVKVHGKKIILVALMIGLIIESLQLIFLLLTRDSYRVVDINDVLFNFLGALIGYGAFKIISWMIVRIIESTNIQLDSFSKYMYDVSKKSINNE